MPIGMPSDRQAMDLRLGRAVLAAADAFAEINKIKAMLDDPTRYSDAILTAAEPAGYGYSQADANRIRAAFAALTDLDKIGHAAKTQPAANDFWSDAKFLLGVSY